MPGAAHTICLVAFLLFPGYVLWQAPGRPTHRAFALLGLAGVLFNGFSLIALAAGEPATRTRLVNLAFLGAFLVLPLVVSFPGLFLGPSRHRTPRGLVAAAWGAAGVLSLLALTGHFVKRIDARGVATGGWALGLWTLTIGLAFLHFVWSLLAASRRTADPALRNRVHYLVLGAVVYAVPSFLDLVHRGGIDHPLPFPLAPWASLGFLLCMGVAVVKHRLLDIEVVLHRGLVLSLTAPALALCFVITGELLEGIFRGHLPPDSPAPDVLAALVVALLFAPFSELLGRFIETFVIAEFRLAPGLRRFRRLPFLIGSENLEELKRLRHELDGIIGRLESRRSDAPPDAPLPGGDAAPTESYEEPTDPSPLAGGQDRE